MKMTDSNGNLVMPVAPMGGGFGGGGFGFGDGNGAWWLLILLIAAEFIIVTIVINPIIFFTYTLLFTL